MEYLAVEILVFIIRTFVRMLRPKRMYIIKRNRSLLNLISLTCRLGLNSLLVTVFVLNFLGLSLFHNRFNNGIGILFYIFSGAEQPMTLRPLAST